jgi:hypothetical protein
MWCWKSLSPPKTAPAWCTWPRLSAPKICRLRLEHDLPVLMTVNDDGTFIPEVTPWRGKFVKDADPLIIQDLERRGLLFGPGPIPTLPLLLALRHPAAVLRPRHLVYPHQPVQRQDGGAEPAHQLGAGAYQGTGASATGWKTTSTGRWAASATGARRCRCGSAANLPPPAGVGSRRRAV